MVTDLKSWLTANKLEQIYEILSENDIDLDIVTDLTDEDLKEIGL